MRIWCMLSWLVVSAPVVAQEDTTNRKTKMLDEVIFKSWLRKDIGRLPLLKDGFYHAGRKNEVVHLGNATTNMALKAGRQLFAKIPGVFVYDMDGSGNQLNIATRGLDPHRSWEFNIRQNGVLTNSDMYGYPASHYSAPMESYEQIELVRGTGALQYGAQFGGMLNFITKQPDSTKLLSFESINTAGSYNLLSTYNAVSGTYKNFSYYAYYYKRHSDGYREQSGSDAEAQYIQLNYRPAAHLTITAEFGRSNYLYKIPGQLTDSMFAADPRMATRKRNYFSPDIYVPALKFRWDVTSRTSVHWINSAILGTRSSVMLDAFATVPDTINRLTGEYKNRQVDIDKFNSKTSELRINHQYKLAGRNMTLASGLVFMWNDLHRRQLGKGTTGTDFDLKLAEPGFGRDMHFKTRNLAVFVENAIPILPRLTLTPGWRMETGTTQFDGKISYYTEYPIPTTIKHNFHLFGLTSQFELNEFSQLYAGISRAYRPVIFNVPGSTYEQIDKNLQNATGYNAEAGIRGKWGEYLSYDISLFRLVYNNRMGTIVEQDENGQPYTFKTNTGDSRTNGVELFIQYKRPLGAHASAGVFTSTSYMDAVYTDGKLATGTGNTSVKGNRLEAVPTWITRNGLEFMYRGLSATVLYSYTSGTYSDALNTRIPSSNGARGYTPEYGIWDLNLGVQTNSVISIRAGVNNLFNKSYFTKRPSFYPGPGIWPADGRNLYVTIGVKI